MKTFACVLLIALSFSWHAGIAAANTIKLGTLAPEGSPWHEALRDMAETWKRVTGGQTTITIFAGGTIGDEPSMVQKMRIGQLQAAALSGAGLHKIANEVQALQMPMMFRSDAELDCVRAKIRPKLEALLEDKGFKVLTWGDVGWVHFFSKSPVVGPSDLKGKKLFVWAGDTSPLEAWKDFGANPVSLPATEIYQALQSGLIEAVPTTPLAALSYQWFPLAPHMTDLKWAPLIGAVVVTKRAWDAIPEKDRPALLAAADETGKRLQGHAQAFEREAVEVMKQHGLVVEPVSAEVAARWEREAFARYETILDVFVPAGMVTEVERSRDACRRS